MPNGHQINGVYKTRDRTLHNHSLYQPVLTGFSFEPEIYFQAKSCGEKDQLVVMAFASG
ncbi:MAG: hypothetical protein RID53_33235 [Coleofasciculus sp. B1-GNL1-01]|uniref:hypothetical protein n=1 Tax=Coleofasciculus sp. B1-GNL1-01 TaxID=3068484 RepID=UPI0032F11438